MIQMIKRHRIQKRINATRYVLNCHFGTSEHLTLFVRTVSKFSILIAVVTGMAFGMVILAEWWAYHKEIKMPDGAFIAVCSDSQTKTSLDPAYFPELFNFSASGAPVEEYALRAIDIYETNQDKLEAIVFDVSPMKGTGCLSATEIFESAARERFMIWAFHPYYGKKFLSVAFKLFRDSVFRKQFKRLLYFVRKDKDYRSTISGGYSSFDTAGFIDKCDLAMAEVMEKSTEASGKIVATDCLRDIIEKLHNRHVRVVLISTPLHPMLLGAIGGDCLNEFRGSMKSFAKEMNCPWFDYLTLEFSDEEWRDGNHLNCHGAKRFSKKVRADVLSILNANAQNE